MVSNKIVISICIILLNIGLASASTLEVGPGKSYTTIQSAVDAANPGDVISVDEGTYVENVVVKKNGISISGKNKEKTMIDAKKTGSGLKLDMVNNIKISGFTIQNSFGSGKEDAGISIYSSNNNVIGNTLIINNAVGISIYKDSNNNIVSGNDIRSNMNYGIFIYSSNENKIHSNNIQKNKIGIYAETSRANSVYANNFIENSKAQAYDNSGLNSWDDGKSGNYWSSYKGNSAYIIAGAPKARDNYPLSGAVAIKYETTQVSEPERKTQDEGSGKSTPGFMGVAALFSLIAVVVLRKRG